MKRLLGLVLLALPLLVLGEEPESYVARVIDSSFDRVPEHTVAPKYPRKARRDRVQGQVQVCFEIDRSGNTRRVGVRSSSNRVFDKPSVQAVKVSTFRPLHPGEPAPQIKACRTFVFSLEPADDIEARGLNGPEAVRYDPELDVYFVSNFNDEPSGDANGFVSKLSPYGELLVPRFMVGTEELPFHGGRGMFIDRSGLWVVDAGGIHLFDRNSGEQLDFVDFSEFELGFLNDIVGGKDGALYVTDTGTSMLYRIVDRKVSLVTEVPMNPNGITSDPETGQLLMAPWSNSDEIIAWDIDTERFTTVGKLNGGGNFDGLEVVGNKIIIASQMDTSLHFMVDGVDSMGVELPGKPADIGIDTKRNRVAVPYVDLNRVDIIQLED